MATLGEQVTLAELDADPYPVYRRLRDHEPVSWVPAVGLWLVTRWDDVHAIDVTPQLFTAQTEPSLLNEVLGRNMLGTDGDEHAFLRAAFEPTFRPKSARAFADTELVALADALLDELAAAGAADVLTGYAEPLSIRALQRFLDLDELDEADLRRWYEGFVVGVSNFERDPGKHELGERAAREFDAAVRPLLTERRRRPTDDALSSFIRARADDPRPGPCAPRGDADQPGERARTLTDDEIISNLRLVWSGGMNEPRDLITLTLYALLTHPDALATVLDDPDGWVGRAVDETARWISPVGTSTRQTTRDTELAGVTLERGSLVAAVLSSANRDPRHWSAPDAFRLDRPRARALAFAIGPHHCLGEWLGRRIAIVGVGRALRRLRGLALDGAVTLAGWEFRGPTALPVRWRSR